MENKAANLIKTLTDNSGRNSFSIKETERLVEISHLEAIGDLENLNFKISEFKSKYVLKEGDWIQ